MGTIGTVLMLVFLWWNMLLQYSLSECLYNTLLSHSNAGLLYPYPTSDMMWLALLITQ